MLDAFDRIWDFVCTLHVSRPGARQTLLFWSVSRFINFLMPFNRMTSNGAERAAKTKLLPPNYPDAEAGSHGCGPTGRKSRIE